MLHFNIYWPHNTGPENSLFQWQCGNNDKLTVHTFLNQGITYSLLFGSRFSTIYFTVTWFEELLTKISHELMYVVYRLETASGVTLITVR